MIVPTILTADLNEAKKRLSILKDKVDRVQIDVVDGEFAKNKTITPTDLLGLEEKNCFLLDFHLMVKDPAAFLDHDHWPGQANLIAGQIEAMPSQIEFTRKAKEEGFLAGLAVDLETSLVKLKPQALDLADQVLLLGVEAGFGGQKMSTKVLAKIKSLADWRRKENWSFKIGVDGGIDKINLAACYKMGAEEFFIGSAIWESKEPVEMIRSLEKIVGGVK
jgi:ribulose-phosphate 3-epimerase